MPPPEAVQCIFCNIAAGSVPSRKVFEDDKVVAILDINPANPGHVLLIPREHATVLPQVPDDVVERMGAVARMLGTASLALFRQMNAQGTTLLAANGGAAGQKAGHAVLHVIPRFPQDGIGLVPQPGQPPADQQDLHAMLARAAARAFGYPEDEYLKNAKPPLAGGKSPDAGKPVPPEKPAAPAAEGDDLDDLTAFLAGRKPS